MPTKEEIYKRCHTYAEFDLVPNKESTLDAMEEWAVIFAQWITNKGWGVNDPNEWHNIYTDEYKSTEELYELFNQQNTGGITP